MHYINEQEATRASTRSGGRGYYDDYDMYMQAGSAGEVATARGLEQVGFWRKIVAHPSYDAFWSDQAVDKVLAAEPLKVPAMLVDSLWDQEDIYGAMAVYKAIKPKDTNNDKVFLVLGPWHHGQEIEERQPLGAIRFGSDTATVVPQECAGAVPGAISEGRCAERCGRGAGDSVRDRRRIAGRSWMRGRRVAPKMTPLYLEAGFELGFDAA